MTHNAWQRGYLRHGGNFALPPWTNTSRQARRYPECFAEVTSRRRLKLDFAFVRGQAE
jgi:hypothetical protein